MDHVDVELEVLISKGLVQLQEATEEPKPRILVFILEARSDDLGELLVGHGLHAVAGVQELIDPLCEIQRHVFTHLLQSVLIVAISSALVVFV